MNFTQKKSRLKFRTIVIAAVAAIGPVNLSADTRVTAYGYHPNGELKFINGPVQNVYDLTSFEYTAKGFLKEIKNGLLRTQTFAGHDARGLPSSTTDQNGVLTHLEWTERGWLKEHRIMVSDGSGGTVPHATQFNYDDRGLIVRITLPDNSYTTFQWGSDRQLDAIRNNFEQRVDFTHDSAGNVESATVKESAGSGAFLTHNWDYDELDRLMDDIGSNGQHTDIGYDKNNNSTARTDAYGNGTSSLHDALNRLKTLTFADNTTATFTYDDHDRLKTVTDQRGFTTTYFYNGFGDLLSIHSPDTGITSFPLHDDAGNVLRKIDARGVQSDYTYDVLNRVKTITYPSEPAKNVEYFYGNQGNCTTCNGRLAKVSDSSGTTTVIYDDLGRVTSRTQIVDLPSGGTTSLTTGFDYDKANRVTQVTYPNGHIVDYTRDGIGLVTSVTSKETAASTAQNVATAIDYEPFGPIKSLTHGNNLVLARTYDTSGRIDTQTLNGFHDLDHDYDNANNITDIFNTADSADNQSFTYDSLYRLESAEGRYGDIDYTYDDVGNRKSRTINQIVETNNVITTETYTYKNDSNRLSTVGVDVNGGGTNTRAYQHDANGNTTEEHRVDNTKMKPHYDATNRMDSVSPN